MRLQHGGPKHSGTQRSRPVHCCAIHYYTVHCNGVSNPYTQARSDVNSYDVRTDDGGTNSESPTDRLSHADTIGLAHCPANSEVCAPRCCFCT